MPLSADDATVVSLDAISPKYGKVVFLRASAAPEIGSHHRIADAPLDAYG